MQLAFNAAETQKAGKRIGHPGNARSRPVTVAIIQAYK
jgi:hypothetical protein